MRLRNRFFAVVLVIALIQTMVPVSFAADSKVAGFPLPVTSSPYLVSVLSTYSYGTTHSIYLYNWGPLKNQSVDDKIIMDIIAPGNTPIYAVGDGTVITNRYGNKGGWYLVIAHNDGTYSYYGHLAKQSSLGVGTTVTAGTQIGSVGMTGVATGNHLHFEWSGHDPYCEYAACGYVKIAPNSGASKYPHTHGSAVQDKSTVTATTKGVDSDLSASNATLRAYVSSSGEKLIECGMYIGTSSSIESMVKLGSDSINTYGTKCFYKTSKYGYKLEAGQTYYYAAYAKTASKTAYGEVKSFTVPGAAPKITLNETSISASENTCVQLVATTTPSGQTVKWSSSDTAVATVNGTGQVECKSFGTATITAKMIYKDKTYTATCKITVQCGDHSYSGGICSKCKHEWKHTETAMNATTFEVTNKDGAPLWSRPYSNNSKQIKTLAKGTKVTIVASTKNQAGNLWYKTEGGYWIYSGNVKKCEEAKTKTYYVTKAGDNNHLAINSIAKSGNQIGRIPSGAAVKVYPDKTSGNWLYVEYNGVKGYAYSGYLTTSKPAKKTGTVTGTNGQHLAINTLPSATGTGGSVKVGRIPPGAQLTVYPELSVGNWYWVEYNGVFGFAYGGYIKLS